MNSSWGKRGICLIYQWISSHDPFVVYLHVFRACECWHGDYFLYILHVSYYILILVIMCVCIYLFMFVYIYFELLCTTWLLFFCMMIVYAWLLWSVMILTRWWYWLIHLPLLSCSFWYVYLHYCISYLSRYIDFLYCTLFWSFFIMLFILVVYLYCLSCFFFGLHVDMDDIFVLRMTVYYMTSLLLCDACIACLCGTHIYPFISNSLVSIDLVSLDLVFHETYCFVCYLTMLVIWIRV